MTDRLHHYQSNPNAELDCDDVDRLGLDGTGRDGAERFPYTWAKLTDQEQTRLTTMLTGRNTRRLDIARQASEDCGWLHAVESLQTAIDLLSEKLPGACLVLVNQETEDTSTIITLLAVYTSDGQMLWFRDIYAGHPDARALGQDANPDLDVDSDDFSDIEDHLRTAYLQPGPKVFWRVDQQSYEGLQRGSSWDLYAAIPAPGVPDKYLTALAEALGDLVVQMYRAFLLSKAPNGKE
jgi:hypothetical protein